MLNFWVNQWMLKVGDDEIVLQMNTNRPDHYSPLPEGSTYSAT